MGNYIPTSSASITGVVGIISSGHCFTPKALEKLRKEKEKEKERSPSEDKTSSQGSKNDSKGPKIEKVVTEFLKFIKHNEYNVVEQLNKLPTCISLLSFLFSFEPYNNSLMRILNQTYVDQDISVENLYYIVGNISVGNIISFNDEEFFFEG